MEIKRVEQIMIPLDRYPHLPHWFTLRQALVEIQNSPFEIEGIRSLPRAVLVFDEKYRLLGYARRRDIMRGLEPKFMADHHQASTPIFDVKVDPDLTELSYDAMTKNLKDRAETQVSEVMQPIKATIDAGDHLLKAISEIIEYDLCLLPVLKDGRVAGVVNTITVCNELAKIIL